MQMHFTQEVQGQRKAFLSVSQPPDDAALPAQHHHHHHHHHHPHQHQQHPSTIDDHKAQFLRGSSASRHSSGGSDESSKASWSDEDEGAGGPTTPSSTKSGETVNLDEFEVIPEFKNGRALKMDAKKLTALTGKETAQSAEEDEKARLEREAKMPFWERSILHQLRERNRKVEEFCATNPEWQAHLKRQENMKKGRRDALARRIKLSQMLAEPRTAYHLRNTLLVIVDFHLSQRHCVHEQEVEIPAGQCVWFQPKMIWELTKYMRDRNNVYWYEFESKSIWGDMKGTSRHQREFRLRYSHIYDIRNIISQDILGGGMHHKFYEDVMPLTPFPEAEGITGSKTNN